MLANPNDVNTFGPTLVAAPPPVLYFINIVLLAVGVIPKDELLMKSPILDTNAESTPNSDN